MRHLLLARCPLLQWGTRRRNPPQRPCGIWGAGYGKKKCVWALARSLPAGYAARRREYWCVFVCGWRCCRRSLRDGRVWGSTPSLDACSRPARRAPSSCFQAISSCRQDCKGTGEWRTRMAPGMRGIGTRAVSTATVTCGGLRPTKLTKVLVATRQGMPGCGGDAGRSTSSIVWHAPCLQAPPRLPLKCHTPHPMPRHD